MKEPQKITVKSKSGNNYIMLLYNCESCSKEVKRANNYKSLNKGKIYCRSCSNKINSRKERVDGEFKVCKSCEQNLPISKFSKSNTGVNHNPCCSKCYALKKFNITRTDYDLLLKQQNYKCAICDNSETTIDNRTESGVRDLSVDHCHNTGVVRGLLCTNCNTLLGQSKDNIEILRKAIEYLNKLKNKI